MKKNLIIITILFITFSCGVVMAQPSKIAIRGTKIYVNDEEFFIKGIAYGLNYPKIKHYSQIPQGVLEKDFQLMNEAGVNTMRTYRCLPDFILDLAEKYNIMVIENVVYPGDWTDFNSSDELERLKTAAIRNVMKHKDRKCILAWDIWNDAPFTFGAQGDVIRRYGEDKVNKFLGEIYKAVKEADPNHPITGASLTYSDESLQLGVGFLDFLSYNVYIGIYDWLDGKYSDDKAKETVQKFQGISKTYNKPVVIAETGYSNWLKATEQGEVIKKQVRVVRGALAGIIIFEWADEWDKAGNPNELNNHIEEHWGVVDGYRSPKEGYSALKEVYSESE